MKTPEQLARMFTYHQPTEETAPKYAVVRTAETLCMDNVAKALKAAQVGAITRPDACEAVNIATRAYYVAIDEEAPECVDKEASLRSVLLVRNAANEAIMSPVPPDDRPALTHYARRIKTPDYLIMLAIELAQEARWLACRAIAYGGQ